MAERRPCDVLQQPEFPFWSEIPRLDDRPIEEVFDERQWGDCIKENQMKPVLSPVFEADGFTKQEESSPVAAVMPEGLAAAD